MKKVKIKTLKTFRAVVDAVDNNKVKAKHKHFAEQYLRGKLNEFKQKEG